MSAAQTSAPILPPLTRQESHTIQYFFPEPGTTHGDDDDEFLLESREPIPLAFANKGKEGAINRGKHGNIPNQSAERRSSDTLRDEHRKAIIFKEDESEYSDNGDTYEDPSRDVEKGHQDGQDPGPTQSTQSTQPTPPTQWDNNVVGWDGPNDPLNPQNWSKSKKYTTTVFYATMTFCITFASSVFSTATPVTAKLFGVSTEVMTLGTSLFVFVSA